MKLAPDILDPSVHNHTGRDPYMVRLIARNMYRTRRYAADLSPREHAKNHLRGLIGGRWSVKDIIALDSCSTCAYHCIKIGHITAKLPRGKIYSSVYGRGSEVFSIIELYKEITAEKQQPTLFR